MKEHMSGFSKEHMHDINVGEGLEIGSAHPAHKKGLVNHLGNHQAKSVETNPKESNHETLRHGSKPQPEGVIYPAPHDPACLSKARMYNERSEAGNANPMAAAGKGKGK